MAEDYINELLDFVVLSVSDKCDRACKHCQLTDEQRHAKMLSKEDYMRIIDQVAELNEKRNQTFMLDFTGNEPTLNPDLPELVEYAADRGLGTEVSTTGGFYATRPKKEAEAYIKELVKRGLHEFRFSLDGSTKEISIAATRDRDGDTRAYDGTIGMMDYCKANGIPFSVETVVRKENIDNIENIIELAHEKGAKGHAVVRVLPRGRAVDGYEQFAPTLEEFAEMEERCEAKLPYLKNRSAFHADRVRAYPLLIIEADGSVWYEQGKGKQEIIGYVLEDGLENIAKKLVKYTKHKLL
jgi:pyrroloquinoline quinone biosynthesis protein E